jgi:hypothetical protein
MEKIGLNLHRGWKSYEAIVKKLEFIRICLGAKTMKKTLDEAIQARNNKGFNMFGNQSETLYSINFSMPVREGAILVPKNDTGSGEVLMVSDYEQFVEDYNAGGNDALKSHLENVILREPYDEKADSIKLGYNKLKNFLKPQTLKDYRDFINSCEQLITDEFSMSILECFGRTYDFKLNIPAWEKIGSGDFLGKPLEYVIFVESSGNYHNGYEYCIHHGLYQEQIKPDSEVLKSLGFGWLADIDSFWIAR